MLSLINAPYPFSRNARSEWGYTIGVGLFIAFFLNIFQPFGTDDFQSPHKTLFLSGYGLVVVLVILIFRKLIPALIPQPFQDERWTVGKHILWSLLILGSAIFASYSYWAWYFDRPFSLAVFGSFFSTVIFIAVFPVAGLVVADYIFWLKRFQVRAANLQTELTHRQTSRSEPAALQLQDENGRVQLNCRDDELLYLQAADNYVEVFLWRGGALERELLRSPLKALEAQLATPPFVRSHRSYIVNLNQVQRVSGNAQGYRLHLGEGKTEVPVSRSRSKEVLNKLRFFLDR